MNQASTVVENSSGTILVVDDQAANVRVVGTLLGRKGYTVIPAHSGPEALAAVAGHAPDLILLDMMMPGMDGFELLAALREIPGLHKVPAVFLTAAQDRDLLLRAFEAGAVDYVTKPFMPEELLARVEAHVGLKLTRDRLERVARERQELVNLVAHDLKNPLTSVLFASDVLRNAGCRPERIPRYLEIIHESSTDALNYIGRYLESQSAGVNSASPSHANGSSGMAGVLDWLERRYGIQYEARGLQLRRTGLVEDAQVAIDGLVLRQVAENLISNALKYAPDSTVDLSVRHGAPGYLQLLVED
ncbi:MAG: hybrid sensor histidine kinase/response regulator, partial [Pseudomonadota bacterium]|nr:hybrid sensor histidine kinase/response regulator [Pseudomonadota bacterium]